jgi:hypothetical protein
VGIVHLFVERQQAQQQRPEQEVQDIAASARQRRPGIAQRGQARRQHQRGQQHQGVVLQVDPGQPGPFTAQRMQCPGAQHENAGQRQQVGQCTQGTHQQQGGVAHRRGGQHAGHPAAQVFLNAPARQVEAGQAQEQAAQAGAAVGQGGAVVGQAMRVYRHQCMTARRIGHHQPGQDPHRQGHHQRAATPRAQQKFDPQQGKQGACRAHVGAPCGSA